MWIKLFSFAELHYQKTTLSELNKLWDHVLRYYISFFKIDFEETNSLLWCQFCNLLAWIYLKHTCNYSSYTKFGQLTIKNENNISDEATLNDIKCIKTINIKNGSMAPPNFWHTITLSYLSAWGIIQVFSAFQKARRVGRLVDLQKDNYSKGQGAPSEKFPSLIKWQCLREETRCMSILSNLIWRLDVLKERWSSRETGFVPHRTLKVIATFWTAPKGNWKPEQLTQQRCYMDEPRGSHPGMCHHFLDHL